MATVNSILIGNTAFNKINVQVITATGTYTPTAGMRHCIVEVQGGGGAAGGALATGAAETSTTTGGAGGGYARSILSAATVGASQSVTIGAGGTGVSGANGNAGGTTSFGSILSATGGAGGVASSKNASSRPSGVNIPGVGSSGNVCNLNGGCAYQGLAMGNVVIVAALFGGYGGGGIYGKGATIPGGTVSANSGAGGAGTSNGNSQSAKTGSNGADGVVIVTEFISVNTAGINDIINLSPASSIIKNVNLLTFTSSGTYTPTSGMTYCIVECQGGGGNGADSGTGTSKAGSGGGGGAYSKSLYTTANIGANSTVVIGGTCSFTPAGTGTALSCAAGSNGNSQATLSNMTIGGAGGSAPSNGNIVNLQGCPGGPSSLAPNPGIAGTAGGNGGCGYMGSGAGVGVWDSTGINGVAAATNSGAGGSGGAAGSSSSNFTGGAGASGIIVITEYIGS